MSQQDIRDSFAVELDGLDTRLGLIEMGIGSLRLWLRQHLKAVAEHEPIPALFEKEAVIGLLITKLYKADELVSAADDVLRGIDVK